MLWQYTGQGRGKGEPRCWWSGRKLAKENGYIKRIWYSRRHLAWLTSVFRFLWPSHVVYVMTSMNKWHACNNFYCYIIEQFNPLIKRIKNVLQNSMGMGVSGIHIVSVEIYVHILQMAMITIAWLFFPICSDNTRVKGEARKTQGAGGVAENWQKRMDE